MTKCGTIKKFTCDACDSKFMTQNVRFLTIVRLELKDNETDGVKTTTWYPKSTSELLLDDYFSYNVTKPKPEYILHVLYRKYY